MEQQVISVEALRCWQCQHLIHPISEDFRRRSLITAVEEGHRTGIITRREVVTLCPGCDDWYATQEREEATRLWWRRFWVVAILASVVLMWFFPVGLYPLYAAILCRLVWKWQARRRHAPVVRDGQTSVSPVGLV